MCLSGSALATHSPPRVCLQHPHILQLLEVFLTDEFLAISTQYAAGGDLAEFVAARCQRDSVTALPEAQARYLFQQLIIAVDFCHQVGLLTCIRSVRPAIAAHKVLASRLLLWTGSVKQATLLCSPPCWKWPRVNAVLLA